MKTKEILELAKAYEQKLPEFPAPENSGNISLAKYIDHTLLAPESTPSEIEKLCLEARKYRFASVCVNPIFIPQVKILLDGSKVKPCTVVGFPLGAVPASIKKTEAEVYIKNGAMELDMVLAIGLIKAGQYDAVLEEIYNVVEISHNEGALVKAILEMCLLSRFEKIAACLLCQEAGADFIKTSTGFSTHGATVEDVEVVRRVVGVSMGVEAAGGIRSLADARSMIKAGAYRLGTSASAKILEEAVAVGGGS